MEKFQGIYEELYEVLQDESEVEKIWKRMKGVTVSFPMALYSKEYIRSYIQEHRNTMSVNELARACGLTERRIRQIMKEDR